MTARRVLDEGRKAWPALAASVADAELEAYLSARAPLAEAAHAADLFLCCACLLGRPLALAELERTLLSRVPGWVARIDASPDFGAEVAQSLRERLLTGARPLLGEYAGLGSLEGWLRVTAVRDALRLQKVSRARPPLPAEPSGGQATDGVARAEAKVHVERALETVIAELDAAERTWLKLYYLDGVSLETIAGIFSVHTSTISRRLRGLEAKVLAALRVRLGHELRAAPGEVDSLIRFVRSHLDVSLGAALKEADDGK